MSEADKLQEIHFRQTEVFKRLDAQDHLLYEIRGALVGNEQLGQKGLVKRVEHVEAHVTAVEGLKLKIAGAIAALSLAGSLIGSKLADWLSIGHPPK